MDKKLPLSFWTGLLCNVYVCIRVSKYKSSQNVNIHTLLENTKYAREWRQNVKVNSIRAALNEYLYNVKLKSQVKNKCIPNYNS